jgi:hypothetical protein
MRANVNIGDFKSPSSAPADCKSAGTGVEQDQTYAELLMRKASDGGMKEAQDFLDRIK